MSAKLLKVFRITFVGLGVLYALCGILSGGSEVGAGPSTLTWVAFYSAVVLILCGLFVRDATAGLSFAIALVATLLPMCLFVAERINGPTRQFVDPTASRIERISGQEASGNRADGGDILRSSIYTPHGEHGWVHIPGSQGAHRTDNFNVVYSIDERGNRVTPDPPEPRGEIVLLGGSYSFGWGIKDKQNYPWILGEKYWCKYKVANRACNGWGTTQAYQVLEEMLSCDDPPDAILYAWVTVHIGRNYLSKTWLDQIGQSGAMNPWFEVEEGELIFKGVVGPERGMEKSAKRAKEVTIKLVEEMLRMAEAKNVPFYVVLLPVRKPFQNEDWFMKELDKRGIAYLNALHLREGFPYETDNHPGPKWHAQLAEFLAGTPALEHFSME
ncbi:MAG: SGNH/GDSL hydrolase family protein [Planctomycetota bacterium]